MLVLLVVFKSIWFERLNEGVTFFLNHTEFLTVSVHEVVSNFLELSRKFLKKVFARLNGFKFFFPHFLSKAKGVPTF